MKLKPLRLDCLFALVASLMLVLPAHAQPAPAASAPSPANASAEPGTTSGVIPWSAIMEKPSTGGQDSFDKPGDAGMNIGNAVKEAVRPIHEGLSQSGVVQSIREFDSEIAGSNRRRDNTGQNAISYSSGSPSPAAPAKSAQQIKREQHAASSMLDQLVKEATPWAMGMMGVLAIGFATKAWMDWLHAKAARPGKLRRSGRRRSHSSAVRSISSASSVSSGGSGGSSSLSNSSGNPASSGASSASGVSSGRRRHRLRRPLP